MLLAYFRKPRKVFDYRVQFPYFEAGPILHFLCRVLLPLHSRLSDTHYPTLQTDVLVAPLDGC